MRVGFEHGLHIGHQLFQLGAGGGVGDTQNKIKQARFAAVVIFDHTAAHAAIGKRDQCAVGCAQACGAEGNLLYRALGAADHHPVAHGKGAFQHDHQAGEKVCGGILRGQRNSQTDQAQAGDQAAHIKAKKVQRADGGKSGDQRFPDIA